MADCLSPAEIERLLAGTLVAEEKECAERHLVECERCRQQAARLRADDELFGKIKQACEAETVSRPVDAGDSHRPPRPPADSIEGYEILSAVHRGGQGVVYKAVQKATKRTVALKVLLEGPYASPRQRHRFEREIDLVASLQHPNIVTVYDSGVTRDGRHFFAMEYIHGQPLDAYLSDKSLSVSETLRLFQEICAAVNYAHQRGVIHRDLKPSNIRIDANGRPHILDFGLAKAAGPDLSGGAPVTVTGEFMGTLAYASPEQTKGDPTLIDIRTDVYSLGVILYEMLTGKYPYKVVGQMADVLMNIAEAKPKRPSTIRRQIDDEVETIVLKSLAKEKERRYQSAENLGRDIENYLSGEPIDAKRDSGWYVLRKALRRYKAPATVAVGYLVIVTIALLACLALWRRATEQRRLADEAREAEAAARRAEVEQRTIAEAERDRALQSEQTARRLAHLANLGNINAAAAALGANETASARRHLEAIPPESRNWEWGYLHAQTDVSLAVMHGHRWLVSSIAFSPDGSRLASASRDGTARIWDVATGKQLLVLQEHDGEVNSVAFSPDGSQLASASEDKTIRLWDAISGSELCVLEGHDQGVYDVAFSPNGARLASSSTDTTVRLWDARTREELLVLRGHENHVGAVVFSPDGTRLASASDDGTVRLWKVLGGEELAVLKSHEGEVYSVAFSPDGALLASGSEDRTIRLWSTSTHEELGVVRGHKEIVCSVTFNPDGTCLASAACDNTVRIWKVSTGRQLAILRGHEDWGMSVAFSPDGRRLASSSGSFIDKPGHNTIRLWEAPTDEALGVLRGHEHDVRTVAVSPDGTRVVSTSPDQTVRLWDAATGEALAVLHGHEDAVFSAAFSPDGTRLASASGGETLRLWDTFTGEELAVLPGHGEVWVMSVAFSPDGTRLASGAGDGIVRILDVSTGEELGALQGHDDSISQVAFSPDGTHLASSSWDRTIRLWDVDTGKEVGVLRGHAHQVRSLVFSPDGVLLASGSVDNTIRLWDAASRETLAVLKGHVGVVFSAAFNPDGTRVASASADTTVRVWDTATGRELAALHGHEGEVNSVMFAPDGVRLVSGSDDKTVRIWDSTPYRVRFAEREEILAARPEAERGVDELWHRHGDAKSIAERLRIDTSLSDPLRRAALNLLLSRSAQHQTELHSRITELHARLVFTDDVVAALEADNSLAEDFRSKAIKKARVRGDTPFRLYRDSWNLVSSAGGDPDALKLALRGAEAAVAMKPDTVRFLICLALAQYRNGRYEEACATVSRCNELYREDFDASRPRGLAVHTMAAFKLGRVEEAQAKLAQLKGMMHGGLDLYRPATTLFEECKQLLEGPAAQAGPPDNAE